MHSSQAVPGSQTIAANSLEPLPANATRFHTSIGAPHSQQAAARNAQSAFVVQLVSELAKRSTTVQTEFWQLANKSGLAMVAQAGQATTPLPHTLMRWVATASACELQSRRTSVPIPPEVFTAPPAVELLPPTAFGCPPAPLAVAPPPLPWISVAPLQPQATRSEPMKPKSGICGWIIHEA